MESIDLFGIGGVGAIVVICLLVGETVKATGLNNKWIPTVVGLCGGALGAAGLYLMPDFPAHDLLSAIAVGIVSGLGSTGAHQVYKQLLGGEK